MDKALLAAYGITYQVRGTKILDEVSLEIHRGQVMALLGPNGAGKSTLMKVMAGIWPLHSHRGSSGYVRYLGKDFLAMPPERRARYVAYVSPDFRVEFPLTAGEAVLLGRSCHGQGFSLKAPAADLEKIQWAMDLCKCLELRDRNLDSLSSGERQRVALARALVQGAKILFLDETLSRMDLDHQAIIGRLLKKLAGEGWSILVVSHDLNLASEWAEHCVFLRGGKIFSQGPTSTVFISENISALYPGTNWIVGKSPATGAPKVYFSI